MQIYLMKGEERVGPFPLEEVNRQLAAGTLSPMDKAWYEGAPGWRELLTITGVIMPGGASSTAAPISLATPLAARSTSYAGFWIRTTAFVIDALILVIVSEIIVLSMRLLPESGAVTGIGTVLPIVICFVYMTVLWSSDMQATIAQKICGLRVVNAITGTKISFLRAVGRWFALQLAMAILFIGVIMVAFTQRKRGLHDMLAGTCVVNDRN
jgi:uncharacterized RDD family membrane protein YckC